MTALFVRPMTKRVSQNTGDRPSRRGGPCLRILASGATHIRSSRSPSRCASTIVFPRPETPFHPHARPRPGGGHPGSSSGQDRRPLRPAGPHPRWSAHSAHAPIALQKTPECAQRATSERFAGTSPARGDGSPIASGQRSFPERCSRSSHRTGDRFPVGAMLGHRHVQGGISKT